MLVSYFSRTILGKGSLRGGKLISHLQGVSLTPPGAGELVSHLQGVSLTPPGAGELVSNLQGCMCSVI